MSAPGPLQFGCFLIVWIQRGILFGLFEGGTENVNDVGVGCTLQINLREFWGSPNLLGLSFRLRMHTQRLAPILRACLRVRFFVTSPRDAYPHSCQNLVWPS